jgi:hypothetical protein
MTQPPLVPLHTEESLIPSKLATYRKLSTAALIESLQPSVKDSLKARPDGTMLDGHHRVKVLRERGVDVDSLPREVIEKETIPEV